MTPNALTPRVQALEAQNQKNATAIQTLQSSTSSSSVAVQRPGWNASHSDTTGGVAGSWQTWSLAGIPGSATHVQLECWSTQNDPDMVDLLTPLLIQSGVGGVQLIGCGGRSDGSQDGTGSSSQGMFPIGANSSIQYNASTHFIHWQIRAVGYWG